MNKVNDLLLALPSKGELEKPTMDFLAACGLKVQRTNERQYVASIPSLKGTSVMFQRVPDILTKVEAGNADLGVTGNDVLREHGEPSKYSVLIEDLGFGYCELVLAVPESWVDVTGVEDLADVAIIYKQKGKDIRIATKYPNLTKQWLYDRGIAHFSLVDAQGALEAAPSIGYADVIADITSTGTTLRENRLKKLTGGTILKSQACLIGNREALSSNPEKLNKTRVILEFIEAQTRAKDYVTINANIQGSSPEEIASELLRHKAISGLRGPTISRVYGKVDENWYTVIIVVEQNILMDAIDHLRKAGGTDITVLSQKYFFHEKSWTYEKLVEQMKRNR